MNPNPVNWFEIYVQDMDRARKFYEAVFQAKLEKLDSGDIDMWAFPMSPDAMGSGGSLVYMKGFPQGSGNTIVYFRCDDCAVEESRVVKAGGKVHKTKFPIGQYGFISLVVDTEATMIGLHSRK
ncbi:MAG TPA: VOC family protein [Usitatibacter sp.]|jgi:hypothetical protein|nr:VOC family protein [Usitatibacter sp.]